MSIQHKLRTVAGAVAIALASASAQAALVEFTYTTTVVSTTIPGVSAGDVMTVVLEADNGGSSLASQSWTLDDLISGHLTIGSYAATYLDGWFADPGFPTAFTTNASGALTSSDFFGTDDRLSNQHDTDSFGSGGQIELYNDTVQDFYGDRALPPGFISDDLAGWSVALVPVPEPSSLALLAAGLGAVGLTRRRKTQP